MNSRMLLAAVATLVLSSAAAAQTASTAARANDRAITDRYLTTVHTELAGKLDTRNAKPGQQVAVRIDDDAQLADGTKLPRGSRLLGHITAAQAQGGEQAGALLVLTFDQAEIKGGHTTPVRCVIEMVTPASGIPASITPNAMGRMDGDPMSTGGNVGMGGTTRPGMSTGSGGVISNVGRGIGGRTNGNIDPTMGTPGVPMGGSAGDPVGMGGGSQGGMGGSQVDVTGRDTIGASGPIGTRPIDDIGTGAIPSAASTSGVRPVVSAGENVSGSARATAVPGVILRRSLAPDASGVLTAMGRNITLESGTRFTMGVITR